MASGQDSKLPNSNEAAQRGDALYARYVEPGVKPSDRGKFVAIDLASGEFEMDADELVAVRRIRHRRPGTMVWITRVGSRYAHRFGAGHAIDAA